VEAAGGVVCEEGGDCVGVVGVERDAGVVGEPELFGPEGRVVGGVPEAQLHAARHGRRDELRDHARVVEAGQPEAREREQRDVGEVVADHGEEVPARVRVEEVREPAVEPEPARVRGLAEHEVLVAVAREHHLERAPRLRPVGRDAREEVGVLGLDERGERLRRAAPVGLDVDEQVQLRAVREHAAVRLDDPPQRLELERLQRPARVQRGRVVSDQQRAPVRHVRVDVHPVDPVPQRPEQRRRRLLVVVRQHCTLQRLHGHERSYLVLNYIFVI